MLDKPYMAVSLASDFMPPDFAADEVLVSDMIYEGV